MSTDSIVLSGSLQKLYIYIYLYIYAYISIR